MSDSLKKAIAKKTIVYKLGYSFGLIETLEGQSGRGMSGHRLRPPTVIVVFQCLPLSCCGAISIVPMRNGRGTMIKSANVSLQSECESPPVHLPGEQHLHRLDQHLHRCLISASGACAFSVLRCFFRDCRNICYPSTGLHAHAPSVIVVCVQELEFGYEDQATLGLFSNKIQLVADSASSFSIKSFAYFSWAVHLCICKMTDRVPPIADHVKYLRRKPVSHGGTA